MKCIWFLLSFVWKDWLLRLNINRWIWNDFALYVLIVDRIIGRNIGPLFTSTTLVVAASAIFLPYHSFIDSRLSQSITLFLVNKRNGVNENKESNTSYLAINDPSVYECVKDNKWNQQKAMCVLWYWILQNRGERWGDDDSCSLTMRSNNEMVWNDWMWIFHIKHPLSVLKDEVSVILVLVTLVSRSKYWIGIVVRYSKSDSKCQTTGFI